MNLFREVKRAMKVLKEERFGSISRILVSRYWLPMSCIFKKCLRRTLKDEQRFAPSRRCFFLSKALNTTVSEDKENYLCLIAIFKNESHVLKEWLDHYIKQGVDKFFPVPPHLKDDRND